MVSTDDTSVNPFDPALDSRKIEQIPIRKIELIFPFYTVGNDRLAESAAVKARPKARNNFAVSNACTFSRRRPKQVACSSLENEAEPPQVLVARS